MLGSRVMLSGIFQITQWYPRAGFAPPIAVRSLNEIAKLWVFEGASAQYSSGEMPSPKALPSQLNSAGNEPFASNEALRILNAEPLEEELLEEELLDDELLDELEEELLDDELLDEELLDDGPLLPPPQATKAADNAVRPQAKKILFMVVSYIES